MKRQSLQLISGRHPSGAREKGGAFRTYAVLFFAVLVLVVAGLGFAYKMSEFAMTIVEGDIAGFGAAAVSVYLIGIVPILFLTLWAVFTGRFHDIERPKYRLFELDDEIERGGELGNATGGRHAR